MVNLMRRVGLWGLVRQFGREIPSRNETLTNMLKDTPEDEKDSVYVGVVTDVYNIHHPKSMRVNLNEEARKILMQYVDSYLSLECEFEPKIAHVRAEPSYARRVMKVIPLIPAVFSHENKLQRLRKQTYRKLLSAL